MKKYPGYYDDMRFCVVMLLLNLGLAFSIGMLTYIVVDELTTPHTTHYNTEVQHTQHGK